MPIYTARCPACEKHQDYRASAHEYCPKCGTVHTEWKNDTRECSECSAPLRSFREERRMTLDCCGIELLPVIYPPKTIKCVDFAEIRTSKLRPKGVYSLGPGFRRPVSTKRDIEKLHDDYNRHYEGERYAKPVFKEDAVSPVS